MLRYSQPATQAAVDNQQASTSTTANTELATSFWINNCRETSSQTHPLTTIQLFLHFYLTSLWVTLFSVLSLYVIYSFQVDNHARISFASVHVHGSSKHCTQKLQDHFWESSKWKWHRYATTASRIFERKKIHGAYQNKKNWERPNSSNKVRIGLQKTYDRFVVFDILGDSDVFCIFTATPLKARTATRYFQQKTPGSPWRLINV